MSKPPSVPDRSKPTGGTVGGAVKDTGLIAAAMRESGTDTMLIEAAECQYHKTAAGGHGGET